MSTSKTYQQSLADVGSETRPPMLERGSYIPWASRFRRYINRKRENRKWLNKALDEGPYQFEMFIPNNSTVLKLQTAEDLQGDALLHYDVEMELMNLILLSIPNDIYNYVDACTLAKDMWKRVERLMRGTIQNKVNRETCFTNEFDQFVAEPGEALVLFLNSLQPEWLKYVTQVHLAKRLTVDTFDDLVYYLQQFEKLVNVSRAKKLEKSHDPLVLIAHTSSSSRKTSSYYVTHPTSVVDYEDEYQVNIQSRNSGNTSTVQCYNYSGKGHYARNCPKLRVRDSKYFMEQMLLAKQNEAVVILTDEQNDFLFANASRMEEIKELSANICLMARIQPADHTSVLGQAMILHL
ncbi:integrase, catalytic region, zinc finger, CCHC-type containing protein [Tanacetum coccineum]